jgi:hypothetical protein
MKSSRLEKRTRLRSCIHAPSDHHEMIAATISRAVIFDTTNDDYARRPTIKQALNAMPDETVIDGKIVAQDEPGCHRSTRSKIYRSLQPGT